MTMRNAANTGSVSKSVRNGLAMSFYSAVRFYAYCVYYYFGACHAPQRT